VSTNKNMKCILNIKKSPLETISNFRQQTTTLMLVYLLRRWTTCMTMGLE